MKNNENRIIFNITVAPGEDADAEERARTTFEHLNSALSVSGGLPNIEAICNQCNDLEKKTQHVYTNLSSCIGNQCRSVQKSNAFLYTRFPFLNRLFNVIEQSRKKNIRILLYPGDRSYIKGLNMFETTHNMIIQFDKNANTFMITEPHTTPPSFYQVCASEKIALLHVEALLVDACMCHYLAVSEAACFHDKKKEISIEKVEFIRYIFDNDEMDFLSSGGKTLVKYVAEELKSDTPYISFFSIFTVASIEQNIKDPVSSFFADYCNLWIEFQKWYYKKHKKMFNKHNVENPLEYVFDRNKYKGQVSPKQCILKIKETVEKHKDKQSRHIFGWDQLYAFVILKHKPNNSSQATKLETIFEGSIHPSKWEIKRWDELFGNSNPDPEFEIIPFMVEML